MNKESSTTMMARRRLKNWKTTICGIALIISPIAIALWPRHALTISAVTTALTGGGFMAAADAAAVPQVDNRMTEPMEKIFK